MDKLIIKGGKIITENRIIEGDLFIRDGRIAAIGAGPEDFSGGKEGPSLSQCQGLYLEGVFFSAEKRGAHVGRSSAAAQGGGCGRGPGSGGKAYPGLFHRPGTAGRPGGDPEDPLPRHHGLSSTFRPLLVTEGRPRNISSRAASAWSSRCRFSSSAARALSGSR